MHAALPGVAAANAEWIAEGKTRNWKYQACRKIFRPACIRSAAAAHPRNIDQLRTTAMDPWARLFSPEVLIPVCGILMPLGIAAIALNFAWKYQERKHKTIVDLLEKGLPVPRELLRAPQRSGSPLMRALTLVGVGVGTCGFLGVMFKWDHGLWAAGLVPLCIGVAQLIAIRFEPMRPPEPSEPSAIDLQ